MTTFLDGPARGKTLDLQCSPAFLRVVLKGRTVDALDLYDDEPEPSEAIYVYRRSSEPVHYIACTRGKNGGCHPGTIVEYRLHGLQPDDNQARDRAAWEEWCVKQERFLNGPHLAETTEPAAAPLPGQLSLF
jgi:hypothetical protein